MKTLYRLTVGASGAAVAISLYWRFAARRHTLPCPSWLSWMLENPFMNSVAGADAILERLGVRPGMNVLDIGCGPGRLTVPAARRVGTTGTVVALDIQSAMLQRLQQKVEASRLTNIRLVQGGAGEGKVGRNAFDRALLVTVLGEIPDRKAALTEIFEALRTGGILSVTEVLPDPHYQRLGTVRHIASEVGFEEQEYFGGFPAYTVHLRKPNGHSPAKIKVEGLSNVSSTLLIPLYIRALESRRPDPLLTDTKAAELVNQLDYDFSRLRKAAFSRIFPLLRMREFDHRVRTFLAEHPEGTLVDIGCGFDTRFYRVDNGKMRWYDLDLPEVMMIRDQLLGESPNRYSIRSSALDFTWMDQISERGGQPYLFLAEGVLPYFELQDVKCLVMALGERFPGAELVFDALPPGFVRWMRWHPALRATKARLGWGLGDSLELERWHPGIRLISQWFYFDQPEPRLRWYKLLKWFAPISKARIVQYKLGRQQ
jgi:O-methyltransferase involved in polyketide biosynthesis/precorrin-6B methylase 2